MHGTKTNTRVRRHGQLQMEAPSECSLSTTQNMETESLGNTEELNNTVNWFNLIDIYRKFTLSQKNIPSFQWHLGHLASQRVFQARKQSLINLKKKSQAILTTFYVHSINLNSLICVILGTLKKTLNPTQTEENNEGQNQ